MALPDARDEWNTREVRGRFAPCAGFTHHAKHGPVYGIRKLKRSYQVGSIEELANAVPRMV